MPNSVAKVVELRERLAENLRNQKMDTIFNVQFSYFWQREVHKWKGRETQQILHVRRAHNKPSNPPPKLYASFVSPVLKVKMHAGLGSANGFAPAILHRMERLVKGPTQLKAGELAR